MTAQPTSPTRCHFIHHVSFEGPGRIKDWALEAGYRCTHTWQHRQDPLPEPEEVDLAVITGGPMSIHDETEFPWLRSEKEWIKQVIARDTPTLGICLGAQLIAHVLGAEVAPMGHKEIGWFPIRPRTEAGTLPYASSLHPGLHVLHWHGDQFEIPAQATPLWESDRCPHQGFASGSALGLQFHLELDESTLSTLNENARHELAPATDGIQSETELLENCRYAEHTQVKLFQLLTEWTDSLKG